MNKRTSILLLCVAVVVAALAGLSRPVVAAPDLASPEGDVTVAPRTVRPPTVRPPKTKLRPAQSAARPPTAEAEAVTRRAKLNKALQDCRGNRVVLTLMNRRRHRGRLVNVGPLAVVLARPRGPAMVVDRRRIRNVRLITAVQRTAWRHRPVAVGTPRRQDSMRKIGMGLSIAGMSLAGIGGVIAFGAGMCGLGDMSFSMTDSSDDDTDSKDCSGALSGGLATLGIGGLLTVVGIPVWVAGAVRSSLANARSRREDLRKGWMWAGVVVTLAGAALAGGGLAWILANRRSADGQFWGSSMLSNGLFAALLIGLPMWVEAWRLRPSERAPTQTNTGAVVQEPRRRHRQLVDPIHEQGVRSRLMAGQPRATVFSTQLTF